MRSICFRIDSEETLERQTERNINSGKCSGFHMPDEKLRYQTSLEDYTKEIDDGIKHKNFGTDHHG